MFVRLSALIEAEQKRLPPAPSIHRGRPKVLALLQLPPPVHGVTTINRIIQNSPVLREHFDFTFVPLRFASEIDDVGQFRLWKVGRAFAIAKDLMRALRRVRPDLVYFTLCPTGGAFLRDLLFVLVIKVSGVPLTYHLHGKGVREAVKKHPLLKPLYRWCFRNVDVIHLSRALFPDVEAWVPKERLFAVPNGFVGPSKVPERIRTETQAPTISFMSSMLAAKGPLVLLSALAILRESGLDFRAEFAGPWREPETKAAFESMVREHGLVDRVAYLGPVYGADKEAFFGRADIFAFPTLSDAFPLASIEAMAHGLPVVASREGALSEIVVEGHTGLLIVKSDFEGVAAALEKLIRDPKLRAEMGRAGRSRYEQTYQLHHFEEKLVDALNAPLRRQEPDRLMRPGSHVPPRSNSARDRQEVRR